MKNQALGLALFAALLMSASAASVGAERAVFETDAGQIVVELDGASAPRSAQAFTTYVLSGDYDGTIFHRAVKDLLVQGGEFLPGPDAGTPRRLQPQRKVPWFDPEFRSKAPNRRGTLAMARGFPGQEENQAPTGFFFNMKDNPHLDYRRFDRASTIPTPRGEQAVPAGAEVLGYAVIGRVIAGMDVLEGIEDADTSEQFPHRHWPTKPVTIQRVRIER